jgi:prevent-host-death family protein
VADTQRTTQTGISVIVVGVGMKTESPREVKNNLSRVIAELPDTGPVVITKTGKASAVLLPIDEDTDLETLLLSCNNRFWALFDRAANSKRWTPLERL